MATIPRRPVVVTAAEEVAINLPESVTIALRDLAGAVKHGLLALSVSAGLAVVGEMLEAEVTELVGPRGKHDPKRYAYRHGDEPRQLTLGGRRVEVRRPRVRTKDNHELELKTFDVFSGRDLLTTAALDRVLHGLSTRNYRFGLEPVGEVPALATGKSAISHRFVTGTARQLRELMARDLSQHDFLALYFDGIEVDEHTIVVGLGIDAEGHKHPLGLVEGSTENKAVCQRLLNDLIRRGLDPERARLVVIDGGKGIRAAVKASFGKHALVHRCRVHKRRNVVDHLPQDQRVFIGRRIDRIYQENDADHAAAELRALADHLESEHPGAAASLREGLEETLTISRMRLSPSLIKTFKSTNPIESMISTARTVAGNVKRWRGGKMIERWTAAGILEAERKFRRINGCRDLQLLRIELDAHEASLIDGERTATAV